jgi:hypothetical protein
LLQETGGGGVGCGVMQHKKYRLLLSTLAGLILAFGIALFYWVIVLVTDWFQG